MDAAPPATAGSVPGTRFVSRFLEKSGVQRRATFLFIVPIVFFGAIDAWAGWRSYIFGDSVSYLDMAKGIADGRLAAAVNGYWSPLYPLILSGFVRFVEPDTAREFVVVRAVNFLILLVTAGTFHLFLKRFLDRFSLLTSAADGTSAPLTRRQLEIAGWAAFLWGCFSLDTVSRVGPDACVMAVVFAFLALMLSMGEGRTSSARFVGLGLILGIGYWAKTIMLPLGFVFLIAALCEPAVWRFRRRLLFSAAALVLVAAPLVAAISFKYGKLSYGESGTLNYAWLADRVTNWVRWQGGPAEYGHPVHTARQIFSNPDAFAFGTPIISTYPPWYDPAYWYEGVRIHFEWNHQLAAIIRDTRVLGRIVRSWAFLVPVGLLALSLCVWRNVAPLVRELREFASLWIVSVAGIGIYVPVHFESRYVASYFCVILLMLVAAIRIPHECRKRRMGTGVALLCLFAALLTSGPRLARAAEVIIQTHGNVRDGDWRVAETFSALGVKPGTPVASIGQAMTNSWARLSLLRVVAEIPIHNMFINQKATGEVDRFWAAPAESQEAVLQAFAQNGARFVIASYVPSWADTRGWRHIPDSDFYYRPLERGATDRGIPK